MSFYPSLPYCLLWDPHLVLFFTGAATWKRKGQIHSSTLACLKVPGRGGKLWAVIMKEMDVKVNVRKRLPRHVPHKVSKCDTELKRKKNISTGRKIGIAAEPLNSHCFFFLFQQFRSSGNSWKWSWVTTAPRQSAARRSNCRSVPCDALKQRTFEG